MHTHIAEFTRAQVVVRGIREATALEYARDVGALCAWLASTHRSVRAWREVTRAHVIAFLASEKGRGVGDRTLARRTIALKSFWRWLGESGIPNIMAEFRVPRYVQTLPDVLSEAQAWAIIAHARAVGSARDAAAVELLYATGARASELCGLLVRDVDFSAGTVRLLGKGGKERIVPVYGDALDALRAHWAARGYADPEDAAIGNGNGRAPIKSRTLWLVVRQLGEAAGVPDCHPHMWRHSVATHMHDHAADIRDIQEFLGHASIATTQLYTRVSRVHLREVYARCHPRATEPPASADPAADTSAQAEVSA